METRIIDMYRRFRAWQLDPSPVKTSSESHVCHGCGNAYKGNFCPVCGQESDCGQADWKKLKDDLLSVGGLKKRKSSITFLAHFLGRPGYINRRLFLLGFQWIF